MMRRRYPHPCEALRAVAGEENAAGFKTDVEQTVWQGSLDVQDALSRRDRARSGLVDVDLSAKAFCPPAAFAAIEEGDTLKTPLGTFVVRGRRHLDEVLLLE